MEKLAMEKTQENREKETVEEPGDKARTDRRKPGVEETQGEEKKIKVAAPGKAYPVLRKIAERLKKIEKDLDQINEKKLARPDLDLLREEILGEIRPLTEEERWRKIERPIIENLLLLFDSLINEYKFLKAGVRGSIAEEKRAQNPKKLVYQTFTRLVVELSEVMADLKVKPFIGKGRFNPKRHYAVKSRDAKSPEQHDMVARCLRVGFTAEIGGRLHLVRPALVEVYLYDGSRKKEGENGREESHNGCGD